MDTQPIPPNEVERLIDLRALEILDTAFEERFDRITRIAQRIFGVPIALVSLVDEKRQWFKSRVGLDATETSREVSFCAHAILGDQILQVSDATSDDRFRDNPLVTGDPKIRFYAGCPIESPDGNKLGTLCVIDREPRELDDDDLQALRDLANMVEEEVAAVRMATTDTLTNLRNRRGFDLVARQVLSFAKRADKPASLVFIDLDGMKKINDELGHDAGDRALIAAARLLRESFRESDVVARLGGDEFCVLLSGASALEASTAIARLQSGVAKGNEAENLESQLSLSVGIADWDPASGEDLGELMKRADQEMYAHKRSKGG
jgi:diguanylate cyclase (GGDEF)-like protein